MRELSNESLSHWESQLDGPISISAWYRMKSEVPRSLCVKFPLVNMSASWFLVSTYLIWIFGSELTLSNNQSSASLWVLDTCLFVGLRLLIIILITASLSSNTYNKASWCENWTFEGTKSTLLKTLNIPWDRLICVRGDVVHMRQLINISVPFLFGFGFVIPRTVSCWWVGWLVFWYCSMNVTPLSPHPINQDQVVHPFAIQHPTKEFPILWNCGILTFVSFTSK